VQTGGDGPSRAAGVCQDHAHCFTCLGAPSAWRRACERVYVHRRCDDARQPAGGMPRLGEETAGQVGDVTASAARGATYCGLQWGAILDAAAGARRATRRGGEKMEANVLWRKVRRSKQ